MLILRGLGVNQHSTWKGSTNTLQGLPLTMLILGWGVNGHSTWKGSANTLQRLPLTMLILGGGQSMLNLERMLEVRGSMPIPPRISNQQSQTCCALWVYHNALWVILPPVTHSCMCKYVFVIPLDNHGYMNRTPQMSGQCTLFS